MVNHAELLFSSFFLYFPSTRDRRESGMEGIGGAAKEKGGVN